MFLLYLIFLLLLFWKYYVLKIHSKYLEYAIGKLKLAWRNPISFDRSVSSRTRSRPLPLCQAKHFFPLVAGFAFILENLFWCSYEYWLNHNRDFPSQNKLQRKNPQVTIKRTATDLQISNKRCFGKYCSCDKVNFQLHRTYPEGFLWKVYN